MENLLLVSVNVDSRSLSDWVRWIFDVNLLQRSSIKIWKRKVKCDFGEFNMFWQENVARRAVNAFDIYIECS